MKYRIQNIAFIMVTLVLIGIGYYAGTRANSSSTSNDTSYENSLATLRKENQQSYNDYQSACANYQTLYSAYNELYQKVGASSGLTKLARVDGARGNEESCYR